MLSAPSYLPYDLDTKPMEVAVVCGVGVSPTGSCSCTSQGLSSTIYGPKRPLDFVLEEVGAKSWRLLFWLCFGHISEPLAMLLHYRGGAWLAPSGAL